MTDENNVRRYSITINSFIYGIKNIKSPTRIDSRSSLKYQIYILIAKISATHLMQVDVHEAGSSPIRSNVNLINGYASSPAVLK